MFEGKMGRFAGYAAGGILAIAGARGVSHNYDQANQLQHQADKVRAITASNPSDTQLLRAGIELGRYESTGKVETIPDPDHPESPDATRSIMVYSSLPHDIAVRDHATDVLERRQIFNATSPVDTYPFGLLAQTAVNTLALGTAGDLLFGKKIDRMNEKRISRKKAKQSLSAPKKYMRRHRA